ncbi:HpcH/HpaI aldolase family protein [Streptomyces doebereineriae]|uniref:Aldolase/citrate lyase family protein n=1 Tax=Streptomyces doebereineriae TaxID=3075528 RepID=A0ABU2VDE1_9ACTN|nr:aldolase/citrate lyase family protein [Streptomyces sp. DSM 41640]MDT0483434.1 aldolase/citrate lyase family protein [Streptomyces sp. DSM 41640]
MTVADVHLLRRRLRAALTAAEPAVGTFVKLASPDVVELAEAAGFAFVVVDLEHSALTEQNAVDLVRHAHACGLPAVVRVPEVDAAALNRLLEAGAAGIQLSMLTRVAQAEALAAVTRFAPAGRRSVSLANRAARFGALPPAAFLRAERDDPPVLVGQIETARTDPLPDLLAPLDVCFVGSTDLAVDLGLPADPAVLRAAVGRVREAARSAAVAFGGWVPVRGGAADLGLSDADYLVVGSDLQMLATALRAAAGEEHQ